MSDASAVVLRAWKDEQYRQSLPPEVRDQLPPRPENFEQLDDVQLAEAAGGATPAAALAVVGAVTATALAVGQGLKFIDAVTDDAGAPG